MAELPPKRFLLFTQDPDDPIRTADLVGLVTLAAALTLGLSVAYDIGFLGYYGLSLADVPSTLSDYSIHALNWLPWIALMILLVGGVHTLFLNLSPATLERAGHDFHPHARAVFIACAICIVIAVATYVAFGDGGVQWTAALLAVTWNMFAHWAVKHPTMGHEFNALERRVFYYAPAVALVMFGLGWNEAVSVTPEYRQRALVQTGGATNPVSAHTVLRSYERGALVLTSDRAVSFVEWDNVLALNSPRRPKWSGLLSANPPRAAQQASH